MSKRVFVVFLTWLCVTSAAALCHARDLSLDERIAAQRAIEQVLWNHRQWPADNPGPKPPLASVVPDERIRAKVEDYLAQSRALEMEWQSPITAAELQEELDRMVRETGDGAMLQELFDALGNDPLLVAETLARPLLVDRRIREAYAADDRIHDAVRRGAEAALAACRRADCMKSLGGEYTEQTFRLAGPAASVVPVDLESPAILLGDSEWRDRLSRLADRIGATPDALPLGLRGAIEETPYAFGAVAVLEQSPTEVRTAAVVWPKVLFDTWWHAERQAFRGSIETSTASFELPPVPTAACTDNTWAGVAPYDPIGRSGHTAVWTGSEMIVWGGGDGVMALTTGGRYVPATGTWQPTSTVGAPTGFVYPHTAVWTGTAMIVWGGGGNTGGSYFPGTDTWTATNAGATAPTARQAHTAVWTGKEMIVWGGNTASGLTQTGAIYNPVSDTWRPMPEDAGPPSARWFHTAVWTGGQMIVWGGSGAGVNLNTGGRFDPVTNTWATTNTTGAPAARTLHTAVWTGTEMIVWGGQTATAVVNTGGRYRPGSDSWGTATPLTNAPSARLYYTAVWNGSNMIVWGGYDGSSTFTGGRYNPGVPGINDLWTPTSVIGQPAGREDHTAVFTGTQMIVYGGRLHSLTPLNDGGRYCTCPDGFLVYYDADQDGYGDPAVSFPSCYGSYPAGFVANKADCNDTDPAVHPGVADSTCDGVDQDCSGFVDDGSPWTCQCVQRAPGLVGWWPGEGNGNDLTPHHNNGASSGSTPVSYTAGKVGQGFYFAGFAYVEMPDSPVLEFPTQMTAEAWVRPDDTFYATQIFSKWSDLGSTSYLLGQSNFGKLQIQVSDDGGFTQEILESLEGVISPGVFSHVAMTFRSGGMNLYVNGQRVAARYTSNLNSLFTGSPIGPRIGGDPNYNQFFVGTIDEVAAYSRELAGSEIKAIFDAGANGGMCRCVDADRDGYGADGGVSCAQSTARDCNDANAGAWLAPVEVTNLMAEGGALTLFDWDSQSALVGPAVTYQMLRGSLDSFPVGSGVETCFSPVSPGSTIDSALPAPGAGWWYLVRARNACGTGTYGTRSNGMARLSAACP